MCANFGEIVDFVDGALVVWSWRDVDFRQENYASSHDSEDMVSKHSKDDEIESSEGDRDDESDDESVHCSLRHTVCFKCIGVTLEPGYQDVLRDISNLPNVQAVPVALCPEPHNPVDSKAIAFVVSMNGKKTSHRVCCH